MVLRGLAQDRKSVAFIYRSALNAEQRSSADSGDGLGRLSNFLLQQESARTHWRNAGSRRRPRRPRLVPAAGDSYGNVTVKALAIMERVLRADACRLRTKVSIRKSARTQARMRRPSGTMSQAALKAFCFLGKRTYITELQGEILSCSEPFADAGLSLKENLETALNVASVPFLMAQSGAASQRFHSLLIAAQIHFLKEPKEEDEEKRATLARGKAGQDFQIEMDSEDGRSMIVEDVLRRLDGFLGNPEFRRAAGDLLNETLVMIWGAFEVFVSDIVRGILNTDPASALRLVTTDPARKYFRKDVSIEVLAARGFVLRDAMGDVLFSDQQLDSLPRMRDVLSALLPNSAQLHAAMAAPSLWLLWQRRHVIVHRRGMVDNQFIVNTGSGSASGSRLSVESDDVDEALLTVKNAAVALMRAVRPRDPQA